MKVDKVHDNVIDIHTHILPGIDDGAGTVDESLQMLKLASDGGTTDIIATPHANVLYEFDQVKVEDAFGTLSPVVNGTPRLHLGCEVHLNYANIQKVLRQPERYTLNRSRYLLLELPNLFGVESATRAIQEFLRAGLTPLLAHAERNMVLQRQPEIVLRWKELGCFIQITGQSILGGFGSAAKHTAEELIQEKLADFVASDAHNCVTRQPDLHLAYDFVSSSYGPQLAKRLFVQNPAAVLSNGALQCSAPDRRRSFTLFRSGLSFRRSIKNPD